MFCDTVKTLPGLNARCRRSMLTGSKRNRICLFCGFIKTRFHHWRNQAEKRNITSSIHSQAGMSYKSKRRLDAEQWYEGFVSSFANRMPDIKKQELPSCLTMCEIYEMYREAIKEPLKRVQFRRMWKQSFKDVIIPKVPQLS